MIMLLTGQRGAGKSTACRRLVERARFTQASVGGVLSLPLYDSGGVKAGIQLVDIGSGEEHQLAWAGDASGIPQGVLQVGCYLMDPEVLEWGAGKAVKAIENGVDLVIVDEIGPLELHQGKGFAPVLSTWVRHPGRAGVIVVRHELVAALMQHLMGMELSLFELTRESREELPARLWQHFDLRRRKEA